MQNHFEDLEQASGGAGDLSIALIGPNDNRRRIVANALAGSGSPMVREFPAYPNKSDVPRLHEQNFDVFIIDLDGDQRVALELVEDLAANSAVTVMVFSMNNDPNLLMNCMRSGAREFLSQPVALGQLNEALGRAVARRPTTRTANKVGGKVLVFLGGKGGSGVTTVACNFAVSLVQECQKSAVLIDLDLPLGDAALESRHHTAILYRGCAAEFHPAGSEFLFQTSHQAQLRTLRPRCTGQVPSGRNQQRSDGENGRGRALVVRVRRCRCRLALRSERHLPGRTGRHGLSGHAGGNP